MATLTLTIPQYTATASSSYGGYAVSLKGSCAITATRTAGNTYVDVTAKWTVNSPGGLSYTPVMCYLTVGSTSKTVTIGSSSSSPSLSAGKDYTSSTSFTVSVGDSAGTLTCKAYTVIDSSQLTSSKTSSTVSGTISYDSRGVSIFKSIPTFTLGTEDTITVTRYVSSYTHTITCTIGSYTETLCTKSSSTSVSWTPSLSLAEYITSAASGTATYKITTYSGSTQIGDTQSSTGAISVPSSVVPEVSSITLSDLGEHPFTGQWVKDMSQVEAVIDATTAYSSSIKTYKFDIDGLTASGSSSTLTFDSTISSIGTVTGTATITDERGRTGKGTTSITVYNYYTPTIDLNLGIDGTTLIIGYTWAVADVNNTNTQSLSIKVVKTSTGSSEGTYTPTLDGYVGTGTLELTIDDLQYETYTITATLTDKMQSVTYTANSGQVALSLGAGGLRAAFFGQQGSVSSYNYDNFLQILGKPSGEGDIGVAGIDPATGLAVTGAHIDSGRQNHGVYSAGYVTDDDLANGTYTSDALWEIYRNSSGQITIGDSSHSCYAAGGFVSGGHNSQIGTELETTKLLQSSNLTNYGWTNILSLSVPAGTWVIEGELYILAGGTALWTGIRVADATVNVYPSNTWGCCSCATSIVTPSSTTTYYADVYMPNNSTAVAKASISSGHMRAVRIA